LHERRIIEAPFERNDLPEIDGFSFRFEAPVKSSCLTAFTRNLFATFEVFPGALLAFTDWSLYRSDEMALVDSLRRSHNEQRRLIDAPGHLFGSTEGDEAIAHCYLAVILGWSAYLYLASRAAIVQFWEGELVTFFSPDERLSRSILEVVRSYGLRVY